MVIHSLFICWTLEKHPTCMHGVRPFYFLLTDEAQKVVAPISYAGEHKNMIYSPYHRFIHDYGERLGLGANLQWTSETSLAIWLNVVVHNSFVHSNTVGIYSTSLSVKIYMLFFYVPLFYL